MFLVISFRTEAGGYFIIFLAAVNAAAGEQTATGSIRRAETMEFIIMENKRGKGEDGDGGGGDARFDKRYARREGNAIVLRLSPIRRSRRRS